MRRNFQHAEKNNTHTAGKTGENGEEEEKEIIEQ